MSDHARLIRLASAVSLSTASVLAVLKFGAAVATGSIAILSLMIDSLADIGASAVTFAAVRIALRPPDTSHRYGHGKAEALSALAQGALVAGSAVFVLLQAAGRLIRPEPLQADQLGLAVTGFSLLATAALVSFQQIVVRRTGSQAIRADRLHYTSDLMTNGAVLVSLILTFWVAWSWLDPIVAAVIAFTLLQGSFAIVRGAINTLMDRELSHDDRQRIQDRVLAHPAVVGIHDLRTREAGGKTFVEFHIEIDGAMSVRAAHLVTDALELELEAAFPEAEIIIHQEPAGLQDDRRDHRIEIGRGDT